MLFYSAPYLFSSLHFQTLLFLFSLTLYVWVCVYVCVCVCSHSVSSGPGGVIVCVTVQILMLCLFAGVASVWRDATSHWGKYKKKKNSTSEIWTETTYRALRKKSVQRERGSLPLKVSLATDAYIFIENILRRYLIWSGKFFIYLKLEQFNFRMLLC